MLQLVKKSKKEVILSQELKSFNMAVGFFYPESHITNEYEVEKKENENNPDELFQINLDERNALNERSKKFTKIIGILKSTLKQENLNAAAMISSFQVLLAITNIAETREIIAIINDSKNIKLPELLNFYFSILTGKDYLLKNIIDVDIKAAACILDAALKLKTKRISLDVKKKIIDNIIKNVFQKDLIKKILEEKFSEEFKFGDMAHQTHWIQAMIAYATAKQNIFICNDIESQESNLREILLHILTRSDGVYYIFNNSNHHANLILIAKNQNKPTVLTIFDSICAKEKLVNLLKAEVKNIFKPNNLITVVEKIKTQNDNSGCVYFAIDRINLSESPAFKDYLQTLIKQNEKTGNEIVINLDFNSLPKKLSPLYYNAQSTIILLKADLLSENALKNLQKKLSPITEKELEELKILHKNDKERELFQKLKSANKILTMPVHGTNLNMYFIKFDQKVRNISILFACKEIYKKLKTEANKDAFKFVEGFVEAGEIQMVNKLKLLAAPTNKNMTTAPKSQFFKQNGTLPDTLRFTGKKRKLTDAFDDKYLKNVEKENNRVEKSKRQSKNI